MHTVRFSPNDDYHIYFTEDNQLVESSTSNKNIINWDGLTDAQLGSSRLPTPQLDLTSAPSQDTGKIINNCSPYRHSPQKTTTPTPSQVAGIQLRPLSPAPTGCILSSTPTSAHQSGLPVPPSRGHTLTQSTLPLAALEVDSIPHVAADLEKRQPSPALITLVETTARPCSNSSEIHPTRLSQSPAIDDTESSNIESCEAEPEGHLRAADNSAQIRAWELAYYNHHRRDSSSIRRAAMIFIIIMTFSL